MGESSCDDDAGRRFDSRNGTDVNAHLTPR
jgi:hypothetical protein